MIAIFNTKAHFVIDLFLIVLLLIVPAVIVGIRMARQRRFREHAIINSICFFSFLAAVIAFEAVVHFGPPGPPLPVVPLVIHLCFAIPCLALWIVQMLRGKRAFTNPAPHRRNGKILMGLLLLTVGTGIGLYVITFT